MVNLNKRLLIIVLSVVLILLIPLVAMQFSSEVNWTLMDFIIAGFLLFGTGLILDLISKKIKKKGNRIVLFIIILGLLILVWLELAVGVFGTPFAGS
tara:strand:+ start:81 stop:371 length:291 start_codon:yes stop_codon:yes gene_type:complete